MHRQFDIFVGEAPDVLAVHWGWLIALGVGLIALGSSDPERFEAGLGTAVLARIGELASAALWPPGSGGAGDESRASGPGQR